MSEHPSEQPATTGAELTGDAMLTTTEADVMMPEVDRFEAGEDVSAIHAGKRL